MTAALRALVDKAMRSDTPFDLFASEVMSAAAIPTEMQPVYKAASTGEHHPHRRKTDDALTFKSDQSVGAGQCIYALAALGDFYSIYVSELFWFDV